MGERGSRSPVTARQKGQCMFRELTRIAPKLSEEDSIAILKNEVRGVLSVHGDDGYPYGQPINYFYNEEDGKIYFHSAKAGHKIDAIKRDNKVSFCVYDQGTPEEGQWWLNFKSVIVFGRVEIIEDKEKMFDIARKLSWRFIQDKEFIESEIVRLGERTFMFALVPENMIGKLTREK